jgi:hypothetical protein
MSVAHLTAVEAAPRPVTPLDPWLAIALAAAFAAERWFATARREEVR